jgi:hypothetical protein
MDLNQVKLTKDEWNAIERPVSNDEKFILSVIKEGYTNVDIRHNRHNSLLNVMKITHNDKVEGFLYTTFFKSKVDPIEQKILTINPNYTPISTSSISRLNSADRIRLENMTTVDQQQVFEFTLLQHVAKCIHYICLNYSKNYTFHYFTLHQLMKSSVANVNTFVRQLCEEVLTIAAPLLNAEDAILHAVEMIETNKTLLNYADIELYEHQKHIFTLAKERVPKLIMYMAPTGTGKTLTPLGLSEQYRVIFVCAARHVGLALARSAIAIEKKIAIAFGCDSADDIRLHYYAAKEYTKNKRSGGIGKVDNSVGDKVEIMICDVKSYLIAMYYMLAFNKKEDVIMYWDEPTILLDYENHDMHSLIHQTWKNNKIPNIVLSSATLPQTHELDDMIQGFRCHSFDEEEKAEEEEEENYDYSSPLIENVVSHDCKKTIPIINNDGFVVLPHHLTGDYALMKQYIERCQQHLTLLRYLDLQEVVNVIQYIITESTVSRHLIISRYFHSIDCISMISIKKYYLDLLMQLDEPNWNKVYQHFQTNGIRRIKPNKWIDPAGNKVKKEVSSPGTSAIYITTKDAFTLTDGPTIYLCQNVQQIASFCIKQANIPNLVLLTMLEKIEYNNKLNEKINVLEKELEFKKEGIESSSSSSSSDNNKRSSSSKTSNKINRDNDKSELTKLTEEINVLRLMIKSVMLNDIFVPNSPHHLSKWAESVGDTQHVFTSNIDEATVNTIMSLFGVEDSWKILLMMGIGVFMEHSNKAYTEIMKQLAEQQKLFIIIANADYIYGTNYQFCHAYLGKDLQLTQEKIIQSMGRVGRNNHQQNYTIRFRDNSQILKLFTNETDKPEKENMNKLFRYY